MARTGEEEEGDIVMGVAKATGRATHMAAVQIILEEKITEIKCQSKNKVQSAWQPRDASVTRRGTRAAGNQQPGQKRPKIHPTWGAEAPIWRKCHHMRAHIQLLKYASFSLRARYDNPAHLERLLSRSLCCSGKANPHRHISWVAQENNFGSHGLTARRA